MPNTFTSRRIAIALGFSWLTLLILPFFTLSPLAQAEDCQTFPQTGFSVCGKFLRYWQSNGGLTQQGYPISAVLDEQNAPPPAGDGKVHKVQYFQRARFEEHLENQAPYDVLLGLLGAEQYRARYRSEPDQDATYYPRSDCQNFPQTGYKVCGRFLEYWQANGGLAQQGYPISTVFLEQNAPPPAGDGKIHRVQYFQRARFEEHMENQPPYDVLLGLLGAEQLKARYGTNGPGDNPSANWWKPTPDKPIHWHWQLSQDFVYPRDVIPGVVVYDIDGEKATAETVAKLHALGPDVKVICYFDAGVFESYRSDAGRFPKSVIGNPDEGWDNSYWLDIRQTDILLPIMRDRMQHWCKDKGFDAIEPDETEVWSNDSGFPITREQNNAYNKLIADTAHSLGLSVGLKGNTTEAPDLWQYFDWTINEQCWEFEECEFLKTSFIDHGKAVFNIEYNVNPNCAQANAWHMNSARRDLELVGPTSPGYRFSPCIPYTKNSW